MSAFNAKEFARHLRDARQEMGLTQKEFAARCSPEHLTGISVPYISLLERGQQDARPSVPFLESIAWGLRRDISEVREWAGVEPAPDWSSTLQAIAKDRNLSEPDKQLFSDFYLRIVPPRRA